MGVQAPLNAYVSKNFSTNKMTPAITSADGSLVISSSTLTALNITAATVVKPTSGRVAKISIITASASAGSINDSATTGGAATANALLTIPANATAGTIYTLDMPFSNGLVATPGASGVLAISYI